jgi:hypothetical protein
VNNARPAPGVAPTTNAHNKSATVKTITAGIGIRGWNVNA